MREPQPIEVAAAAAFGALQRLARERHGGNTQPLLVVYATESFLRRLAMSTFADRMVLKGGMLMAAKEIRRMTRDADLATHGISNDEGEVRAMIAAICALVPFPHDGIEIDVSTIMTHLMREEDEYHGVRCKAVAHLGRARIPLSLDLSFGDPGASQRIELRSVLDWPSVPVLAYPLALNVAEKVVTAMQRRDTSTRDRDFADIWAASRLHTFDARELRTSIVDVARLRDQPIITLAQALAEMPDRQQPYAAMVARMSYLTAPPDRWTDVIAQVIEFVDPLLHDDTGLTAWAPEQLQWS